MALDRIFCPIKSNKSSKSKSSSHQTARTTESSSPTETNNKNNVENQTATSQLNYVTRAFTAIAKDELTVYVGDVVVRGYSIKDPKGESWTHVYCIKTNNEGFVPSEILSVEPKGQCKKKMPRSIVPDPIEPHSNSHSQRIHYASENTCHSNGGSIRLQQTHMREHRPRFELPPNSLQGSSGCRTFHKYPDIGEHFEQAVGYYNLRASDAYSWFEPNCKPCHRISFDLDLRPLHLENQGCFMVMHNFVPREENDLSVRPGEYVTVLNNEDKDWYWVRRDYDHTEGYVPAKFVCPYEQVQSVLNRGNSTVTMKSSNQNDLHTYMNHGPDRESSQTDQRSSVFQHI